MSGISNTSFFSNTRSAAGVVGPLANSAIIFAFSLPTLAMVMLFSSAEGHRISHSTSITSSGVKEIAPDDVIEVECDILCPSALENSITMANVGNVKAKIIAELANGPTTPAADRVFEKNDVLLIPDILCNAGGVTVSYYEWVQDQYSFFWSEKRINQTLEDTMGDAFHKVHQTAQRYGTDMRTGAYILAIDRVAEATRVRGIFP